MLRIRGDDDDEKEEVRSDEFVPHDVGTEMTRQSRMGVIAVMVMLCMLNLEAELKREKKKEKSNNGSEWYARYASIIMRHVPVRFCWYSQATDKLSSRMAQVRHLG
jgi:hypothetical protein